MTEDGRGRPEGAGERLLGSLLERAQRTPPQLIASLVAEELGGIGGRDVCLALQDYAQELLVPIPGRNPPVARRRQSITVAAEMQWSLLPPLAMSVPQVEVASSPR